MTEEVELKLAIDPAAHARLRRAQALAGARPVRREMESLYFDTPDCRLARHGMALRLRRAGGRWMQCLKAGASGPAGMHARDEWESAQDGPRIDLARFAHTPLARVPGARRLHERLALAFRVRVVRTAWDLAPAPGVRLEVALDAGYVESRGRREAISEVEIECVEGGTGAAFDLADRLLDEVALRPTAATKAERGYRLFRRERRLPVKAQPVVLAASMPPAAAARRAVSAGLGQFLGNVEGVLAASDPEFVHQARIGLRRARAALRIFAEAIGVERSRRWREALRSPAQALGRTRDWDVFALEVLPRLGAASGEAALARTLRMRAARRRGRERAASRAEMAAAAHARCVLAIVRWLSEDDPVTADRRLASLAARVLRRRHKRLMRLGAHSARLDAAGRHRVRILAKRLRYGTDAFASLYPARKVARYRKALAALQDVLGHANDAATAARLLDALHPPAAFAAFARGWCTGASQPDPAALAALFARLGEAWGFAR